MGQRGSLFSPWADRLIASGVGLGLGVGLGIAAVFVAGTMGVAKFLAPNNDSDAAAPKNGILLRFNGGTVTEVLQDNKGNYGVIICTNPNTAATECGEEVFPASARDLMVEINGNKTSLADAAMAGFVLRSL
jgi:hypothetical protein